MTQVLAKYRSKILSRHVKARTGDDTTADVYNNWYKSVYMTSMSQVQATMGITKDAMSTVNGQSVNTMDTLSNLAKKMGAETSFSAKQCGDALNFLALAGYDTQQMCDTLPTVLNLAAAGSLDLVVWYKKS